MSDSEQLPANVLGWTRYVEGTEFANGDTLLARVVIKLHGIRCVQFHVVTIVEGGCEDSNGDPWGWALSDMDFYATLSEG